MQELTAKHLALVLHWIMALDHKLLQKGSKKQINSTKFYFDKKQTTSVPLRREYI